MAKLKSQTRLVQYLLVIGNIFLLGATYFLVVEVFDDKEFFNWKGLFLLFLSFIVCVLYFQNGVESRSTLMFKDSLKHQLKIIIFSLAFWLLLLWILKLRAPHFRAIVEMGILAFVLMEGWFLLVRNLLIWYREQGRNCLSVIIVGTNRSALDLYEKTISFSPYGYRFYGFFSNNASKEVDEKLIKGSVQDVIPYLRKKRVDEIYFAVPQSKEVNEITLYAENNMIRTHFLLDLNLSATRQYGVRILNGTPVVSLHAEPLSIFENRIKKRMFDLAVSTVILLTLFPILCLALGTMIKLTSKGPVFFKQKRTGLNGKEFSCWKFRTMRPSEDADLKQATRDDERITKIGTFMRKTNLDEMPQFINVFLGQMSVVGPRPHMLKHTDEYSMIINGYMLRHFVRPGVTGWAQVNGFRGETQHIEQMKGRIKKDIWYIENWTFYLDLKTVWLTICNMCEGEENAF